MRSWVASLVLHGAAAGLAASLWLEPAAPMEPEPLRWQVALAPAPAEAPTRRPTPPAGAPPPPVPVPRQAETPQMAPPQPVAAAVLPQQPPPSVPTPAVAPEPADAPAPVPIQAVAQAPVHTAVVPPPARPAPVPSAPSEATAAEVERRWYLALLERLRELKRYPMAARRLGQEGVVLVEARIGPDGRLEGAAIKRGSGYALLDRDALRLLEAAAETARGQLQPERPTRLEIPIAYRLES